MKYCLLCDTEYLDHVNVCAEDGEPLVDRDTYDQLHTEPLSGPLRVLRVLEGPFHADVVRDVLEKEHIPHAVRSRESSAFSRIYMPSKGWGMVLVLASDFDRADAAVRAVMETAFEDLAANGGSPAVGEDE